ncbi:hypothetical protein Fmac_027513 [Flemingia macrophylla]|uniref:Uncharacterized protein n=1 Tax=Flemingia macrophylla TaxID=520843 RepID=A0ABD1LHY6_9FABA
MVVDATTAEARNGSRRLATAAEGSGEMRKAREDTGSRQQRNVRDGASSRQRRKDRRSESGGFGIRGTMSDTVLEDCDEFVHVGLHVGYLLQAKAHHEVVAIACVVIEPCVDVEGKGSEVGAYGVGVKSDIIEVKVLEGHTMVHHLCKVEMVMEIARSSPILSNLRGSSFQTVVDHRFPSEYHNLYDVTLYTHTIRALLTSFPFYVNTWLNNNARDRYGIMVGLSLEWKPNMNNTVATLQLYIIVALYSKSFILPLSHTPLVPSLPTLTTPSLVLGFSTILISFFKTTVSLLPMLMTFAPSMPSSLIPDIAQGLHDHLTKHPKEIGVGSQGHMYGYPTYETHGWEADQLRAMVQEREWGEALPVPWGRPKERLRSVALAVASSWSMELRCWSHLFGVERTHLAANTTIFQSVTSATFPTPSAPPTPPSPASTPATAPSTPPMTSFVPSLSSRPSSSTPAPLAPRLAVPLLSNLCQTATLGSKVRAGRGGHQPGGGFHQRQRHGATVGSAADDGAVAGGAAAGEVGSDVSHSPLPGLKNGRDLNSS